MITPLDNDNLQAYIKDIWSIPLISVKEEIRLARLIKKGDAQARETLITSNLRLVIKIAYEYANYGLPLIDLIAEGNTGLMKAAERFNPKHKCKFSTYAAWWIKQAIKRALANQSKVIRLPVHLVDKISRIKKTSAIMDAELGRAPSDEEIGDELGMTARKVTAAKQASIRPMSLDASPAQLDQDAFEPARAFHDCIEDESAIAPDEMLLQADLRERIVELLDILTAREKAILIYRFGLNGGKPKTLEVVGKYMKITRERVRQLQNEALAKLKHELEQTNGTH